MNNLPPGLTNQQIEDQMLDPDTAIACPGKFCDWVGTLGAAKWIPDLSPAWLGSVDKPVCPKCGLDL